MKPHELRRKAKRAFLAEKRKTDPSYGRKSEPEWKISHHAVSGEARKDGIIYSVIAKLLD